MTRYEVLPLEKGFRLQFTLRLEPDTRKALTLEQMMTVFRRTLRPEHFTCEEERAEALDSDQLLLGQNAQSDFRAYQGLWSKEGRTIPYYLDDATDHTPEDGVLTAGLLQWDLERADDTVEGWFRAVSDALWEAQENLCLFGHI